jgi:carboxylesterase
VRRPPWRRFLVLVPLLPVLAVGCHACATDRAVEREILAADRDPATGVIRGTEAVNLGPPDAKAACLLIHGFVGSRKDFADLGDRLADAGFFVHMTRLPGHGTTPRDFADVTPDEILTAAQLALYPLLLRFDRVYLVGFSMGGAVSTILASEPPSPLSGLVLVAPYYKVTYYWYYLLPPMTWNAVASPVMPYVIKGDRFVRVNRREAVPHIFSYRAVPTSGAKTLEALGKRARQPETLAAVSAPVLMLQAEGDEAASPAAGKAAFERLGSTEKSLRLFDDRSNHHLLWDYDAEAAKDEILNFLIDLEARHATATAAAPPA